MTAVEFLSEQIRLTNIEGLRFKLWDAIEQAKEMENQQQGYSEEDMKRAFKVGFSIGYGSPVNGLDSKDETCEVWFEQFKKK